MEKSAKQPFGPHLRARVQKRMRRLALDNATLARNAGVDEATVSRLLTGRQSSGRAVEPLLDALELQPEPVKEAKHNYRMLVIESLLLHAEVDHGLPPDRFVDQLRIAVVAATAQQELERLRFGMETALEQGDRRTQNEVIRNIEELEAVLSHLRKQAERFDFEFHTLERFCEDLQRSEIPGVADVIAKILQF